MTGQRRLCTTDSQHSHSQCSSQCSSGPCYSPFNLSHGSQISTVDAYFGAGVERDVERIVAELPTTPKARAWRRRLSLIDALSRLPLDDKAAPNATANDASAVDEGGRLLRCVRPSTVALNALDWNDINTSTTTTPLSTLAPLITSTSLPTMATMASFNAGHDATTQLDINNNNNNNTSNQSSSSFATMPPLPPDAQQQHHSHSHTAHPQQRPRSRCVSMPAAAQCSLPGPDVAVVREDGWPDFASMAYKNPVRRSSFSLALAALASATLPTTHESVEAPLSPTAVHAHAVQYFSAASKHPPPTAPSSAASSSCSSRNVSPTSGSSISISLKQLASSSAAAAAAAASSSSKAKKSSNSNAGRASSRRRNATTTTMSSSHSAALPPSTSTRRDHFPTPVASPVGRRK